MKQWVICTGPDWFRPSITSTRQIIFQFVNEGKRVLWVNPVAFKSPAVNSDNKKSMKKKIFNKLKTHLKIFRKTSKNIFILVPFYIPIFNPFFDKLNAKLVTQQVKFASLLLNINWGNSILWISGNFTLSPLLKYRFKKKIYQAADLISDYRTNDHELLKSLREKEVYLSRNVDHLFASSPKIKQKLEELSDRNVNLLTHGVDLKHFIKDHALNPIMVKIIQKGLPIAGYYGTLSDANDKQVFLKLAQNGFSVVIIGKVLGDYSMLEGIENIYFTGPVEFDQLPSYARGFDVCLLNWIMADWIKNSFPVKFLEYLAMGKPVVSCRIPVIEELFFDFAYFADSPQEFIEQAWKSIRENNKQKEELRIAEAAKHTWDTKFKLIKETIS